MLFKRTIEKSDVVESDGIGDIRDGVGSGHDEIFRVIQSLFYEVFRDGRAHIFFKRIRNVLFRKVYIFRQISHGILVIVRRTQVIRQLSHPIGHEIHRGKIVRREQKHDGRNDDSARLIVTIEVDIRDVRFDRGFKKVHSIDIDFRRRKRGRGKKIFVQIGLYEIANFFKFVRANADIAVGERGVAVCRETVEIRRAQKAQIACV